jgi:hypothetical protein
VPHLVAGRGTADDTVLGPAERDALLHRPSVVEEKLDGANVMVWWEDGWVRSSGRAGPGGLDRAGQLGPLRSWLAERAETLRPLLESGRALYAEWLLFTHTVAYERLPAYLVGLDVLEPDGAFAPVDTRNRLLADAGLAHPPELFRGTLGDVAATEALIGPSRVGGQRMEGVVVRSLDGREPRLAKLLAPGFVVLDDEAWRHGRPKNLLMEREASWR